MPSRYQLLREAVRQLAAPAPEQVACLDAMFVRLTGGGSAAAYGNDELAIGLDDIFMAANDMIAHDELSEAEAAAIRPLDASLVRWSGEANAAFWRREALFHDPRWDEVRSLARHALAILPDEPRNWGRFAGGSDGGLSGGR
ncbi:hypothetical protein [Sphingomonas sp. VNH70]|uniref:hypothetical protein n=1 Tax=Sphingomonas silueang TaxID=3156617 RepID=UPI0032B50E16